MAAWPYNTARWKALREQQLQDEPLCRYCEEQGRVQSANTADHIEPVAERPDLAFDQDNLQSLCGTCHSAIKQAEERTGHRRGCDVDGQPLDPHHPWSDTPTPSA